MQCSYANTLSNWSWQSLSVYLAFVIGLSKWKEYQQFIIVEEENITQVE